jgi:hypothetical protein
VTGPETTTLVDEFEAVLREDGWPIERGQPPEAHVLRTAFAGTDATWRCEARVFADQGQIVFDSILPEIVAEERRADACYLLVRANWELLTGSFLMQLDTGELRFRTSLLSPADAPLPHGVALGMVYASVLTVDRTLADLLGMMRGDVPVEETLDRLALG